ncbi:putative lipoprotein [Candidatus Moduliflexus flocculans]|uniref:Putative lipoprotein n=1 Tax=Candidatus Moduliflexus flocculans TaxID=1499966 RepID=A0A081BPF4_9BACT|nr:putative lipoprotein [Candidatus Moduliflexus flocculans]
MKRIPREILVWLACLGFFLIIAVSVNYHHVLDYMFSDEMAYYMMAQSLSADNDLIYTQQDLRRVYEEGWHAGPIGIFLNKTPDGTIYISKSFIYSWVLSPFFTLFGFNGFLIVNVIFFFLCILMAWLYLRQYMASSVAMAFAMMFFMLSASMIYVVWLTPEIFTMFCVTLGLFLWLYEQESPRKGMQEQRVLPLSFFEELLSCLRWLFLTPHGRRYLAPLPLAFAAMAKLPNILFFVPLIADMLFFGGCRPSQTHAVSVARQRVWRILLPRFGKTIVLCAIFAGMFLVLSEMQTRYTGSANPYGGDRRTFVSGFPFDAPEDTWQKGIPMTTKGYFTEDFFFHLKTLLYNIYYYVVGRFTGILPYFTASLLAAALFFWQFIRRASLRSDEERRALWQRGFLFVIILASIGAYIVLMPINYHGGGGAFGNRYFINIYPAFLFLITAMPRLWPFVVSGVISAIFLAPSLITPFQSSYFPAFHAFRLPFRLLPVEFTLIDTLPTNVDPKLAQTEWTGNGFAHRLYFFDDHALDTSPREFLVAGGQRAELGLRTTLGQQHLAMTITNGVVPNQVDVAVGEYRQIIHFSKPYETRTFALSLEEFLPYFKNSLYPISVFSHAGAVPKFVAGANSLEIRNIGCRVSLSLNPIEVGSAYLENGQADEALSAMETAQASGADEFRLRYLRGLAYQHAGKHDEALRELRWCEQHLADFFASFLSGMAAQPENVPSVMKFSTGNRGEPFALFRYEAEELPRSVGDVFEERDLSNGAGTAFVPEQHHQGYLAFGQYVELPPGEYQANFRMKIGESADIVPEALNYVALFLDVYNAKYGLVAEEPIRLTPEYAAQFGQFGVYPIRFALRQPLVIEFRARATGYAPIEFDAVDLIPLLPTRLYDALGVSLAQQGEWEEAERYFHAAANPSIRKPAEVQAAFVKTLLHLQQWDEVLEMLSHEKIDETGHTGQWTHVLSLRDDSGELPNIPSQVQEKFDEMWRAFSPVSAADLTFGKQIRFLGYDVSASSLKPGEQMRIRYYWQALAAMNTNYTIFVHITRQEESAAALAANRLLRRIGIGQAHMFQQDHAPFHGDYPTRQWLQGEWLREEYTVMIPPQLAPGVYDIWIGVYDPTSGQRLISKSGEKTKIGELTILQN